MNNENIKFTTLIIVSILLISILFVPTNSSHLYDDEKGEKEIVLVDISKEELNDFSSYENFDIIQQYSDGNKFLVETIEDHITDLKQEGYNVNDLPNRTEISVKGHTFDIFEDEPPIDPELKLEDYSSRERGLYLVHMLGPIHADWKETLREHGIEIINYVPNYAYVVKMCTEHVEKIEELPFVDWVDIYHPGFKVPENLESEEMKVRLAPGYEQNSIDKIHSISEVEYQQKIGLEEKLLSINTTSRNELEDIAKIPDVYFLYNNPKPELHSEVNSQIIGGGAWIMDDQHDDPYQPYRKHGDYGSYINQLGYSGEGVTIAVVDTGIGDGTIGDAGHPDFTGRVVGGHGFGELDEDDWSDKHSHGTHVAGSAAGHTYGGSGRRGEYPGFAPYLMGQGIAYGSELFSAKIFNYRGSFQLEEEEAYSILEIPKQEADADVHTNSWGSASFGEYLEYDSIYDSAVRDANSETDENEPLIITSSAGNSGPSEGSISSPGNAKNVITIGATESFMPDGRNYGGRNTDNPFSIASFSSRGWTEDNRIKPDVVAPGENVLSFGHPERTSGATYEWKSGTSMSNPAVAGASAVVYEWYEKNFGEEPSPAMVRSLLINTAHDIQEEDRFTEPIPNKDEGWGMVDISKLEYPKEDPLPFFVEDQDQLLKTGDEITYEINPDEEDAPLKITLSWTDKEAMPGDNPTLKNNLDLEVVSPSGDTYRGNSFERGWSVEGTNAISDFDTKGDGWDNVNNVQNVYIHPDQVETEEGPYKIRVIGTNIPADSNNDGYPNQDFALTAYNAEEKDQENVNNLNNLGEGENEGIDHEIKEKETSIDILLEDKINKENLDKRDPIKIRNNYEMALKAYEEGWEGSGTEDDPYEISGYHIDAKGENTSIHIENVDSHFILIDNLLTNSSHQQGTRADNNGLYMREVHNGSIEENVFSFNSYGVRVRNSKGLEIKDNIMLNNHVGITLSHSENNIIMENTVKKLIYPIYGEGIKLEHSSANEIKSNEIKNNNNGLDISNSEYNIFSKNEVSHHLNGLYMQDSTDNEFIDNILSNSRRGLHINRAENNLIEDSKIIDNDEGILMRRTGFNTIRENEVVNSNRSGIRYSSSQMEEIFNNTISQSDNFGIYIASSSNMNIRNNELVDNSLFIDGDSKEHWNSHSINEENTINGKPIYYWRDKEEGTIPEKAGQVILANSSNITIENQDMDTGDGISILLGFSDDNMIRSNEITRQQRGISLSNSKNNDIRRNILYENTFGIQLVNSNKNTIAENEVENNSNPGIYIVSSEKNLIVGNLFSNNYIYSVFLTHSYDNIIYHNEFYNDEFEEYFDQSQAFDNRRNSWDSNSEGNYWADYDKRYEDHDKKEENKVWNTPYEIDGNNNSDHFPLVKRDPVDDFTIQIINPTEDEMVFSSEVTARWSSKGASGEVNYQIRLNSEDWKEVGEDEKFTFEDLEDGEHFIEVKGEDDVGSQTNNISFTVETGVHVNITNPEQNEIIRRSFFTARWESHNEDYNEIKIEGKNYSSEYEEWTEVGPEHSYDFSDIDDGDYIFHVKATCEDENYFKDNVSFEVKTVDINITSPQEDEIINNSKIHINWESENAKTHEIRIDDGRWDMIDKNKTTYVIDNIDPGEYTIRLRARDEVGFSSHDSVRIEWTPKIDIMSPMDDAITHSDKMTISWRNTSIAHDIHHFEIRKNEQEWENLGLDTQKTFENLSDGRHFVKLRALFDGEVIKRQNVTFTVDTTPPILEIDKPQDSETIYGDSLDVKWSGYDNITNISHYEIRIEGEHWTNLYNIENYTFEDLESGEYTIEIRAWDEAGNKAVESVTVELRSEIVNIREFWWLTIVIAILLILIIDKITWKNQRKSKIKNNKNLEELESDLGYNDYKDIEDRYKL